MSVSPEEQRFEEAHLSGVIREIDHQMAKYGGITQERRENVIDVRKMIWEEMRQDNANWSNKIETAGDVVANSLELARIERGYLSAQSALRKLGLLRSSPYFGRIDFLEDGANPSQTEKIYIGLSSLLDDRTLEPVIFDWRSPIASMYYDYTLGRAKYATPEGHVEGELLLKRQFKINGGLIQLVFDSGIRIGDDMLQFMLGKSSDEKMKSIVTTIQSEQNRVIRNEEYPVLIVQGAAGSGKTSIALQRVAYLLYKYRKSIQADQMILFSPNPLFSDYISNVLPELGEDNMRQTTFQDFAEYRLGRFIQPQDRYEQMETMLTASEGPAKEAAAAGIAYKVSRNYLDAIRRYLELLASESICFDPVPYGEQPWKREEELSELFYGRFGHHQIHVRLERMAEVLLAELPELEDRQAKKLFRKMMNHPKYLGTEEELGIMSKKQVRRKIAAMAAFIKGFRFVNPITTYRQLFESPELFRRVTAGADAPNETVWEAIRADTLSKLDTGKVPYEDVPPLLYLFETITGWNSFNSMRHVILDEAQDYSPFQYEIIRRLFPRSKLTLLGDLNQAIQPHMRIESYEFLEDLYGKDQTGIMRLTKSYRSTAEIVEFTKAMLPGGEAIESFSRSGSKPILIQAPDRPEEGYRHMADTLRSMQAQGVPTIAVICKTAAESEQVHRALLEAGAPDSLHLIVKEEAEFRNALVVLPVYLAKGLEFDTVLIPEAGERHYGSEEERKLFYTACTRAMNGLLLYHTGAVNRFLAELPSELYQEAKLASHS
ncbi:RNA polymerase recycling motor HelD [Gorillibacterium sp. sgz5001074]|uniref:RNA polymerase recycling motor HelD n=1 Tax=Gorillibacterium sp. sgz5001074 TaxID=3446695 RepID=UPI003F67CDC0